MHSAVLSAVVNQEFFKKMKNCTLYTGNWLAYISDSLSLMKSKVEDPNQGMLQRANGRFSSFFFKKKLHYKSYKERSREHPDSSCVIRDQRKR